MIVVAAFKDLSAYLLQAPKGGVTLTFTYPTFSRPRNPVELRYVLISHEYSSILASDDPSGLDAFANEDTEKIASFFFPPSNLGSETAGPALIERYHSSLSDAIRLFQQIEPDAPAQFDPQSHQELLRRELAAADSSLELCELYQRVIQWQIHFSSLYADYPPLREFWIDRWPLTQANYLENEVPPVSSPEKGQDPGKPQQSPVTKSLRRNHIIPILFAAIVSLMMLIVCHIPIHIAHITENANLAHTPEDMVRSHKELVSALELFPQYTDSLQPLIDEVDGRYLTLLTTRAQNAAHSAQYPACYAELVAAADLLPEHADQIRVTCTQTSQEYIDYSIGRSKQQTSYNNFTQAHQILSDIQGLFPEYNEDILTAIEENRASHFRFVKEQVLMNAHEGVYPGEDTRFDDLAQQYPGSVEQILEMKNNCCEEYFTITITSSESLAEDGDYSAAKLLLLDLHTQFPERTEAIQAADESNLNIAIDTCIRKATNLTANRDYMEALTMISEMQTHAPEHTALQETYDTIHADYVLSVLDQNTRYLESNRSQEALDNISGALSLSPQDPNLLAEYARIVPIYTSSVIDRSNRYFAALDYPSAVSSLNEALNRLPDDPELLAYQSWMEQYKPIPIQDLIYLSNQFTSANGVTENGNSFAFNDHFNSLSLEAYLKKEFECMSVIYTPSNSLDLDNAFAVTVYADGEMIYDSGVLSKHSPPNRFKITLSYADIVRLQVINMYPGDLFTNDAFTLSDILFWKHDPSLLSYSTES